MSKGLQRMPALHFATAGASHYGDSIVSVN